MTITATLLNDGRDHTRGAQFENHSQSYVLCVEECTTGQPELYDATQVLELLATTGISTYRVKQDAALEVGSGATWEPLTPATEYGRWLCRNISCTPNPNKKNSWVVRILETNMGRMYVAETTTYEGDADVSVNWTATGKKQQAWRSQPELPEEVRGAVNPDNPYEYFWCKNVWDFCTSAQDIGGEPCAFGMAQPIQLTTRQSSIQIEYVVRAPIKEFDGTDITPYVNSAGVSPYLGLQALEAMVGKRSWQDIGSYEAGYLLMENVSVQPLHYEFKRVTISMTYDEWKHAFQRPFTTKSGVVAGEITCADGGEDVADGAIEIVNLGAMFVGWLQPYSNSFSFGETPDYLFNDGTMSEVFWKLGADPSTYVNEAPGSCETG